MHEKRHQQKIDTKKMHSFIFYKTSMK